MDVVARGHGGSTELTRRGAKMRTRIVAYTNQEGGVKWR